MTMAQPWNWKTDTDSGRQVQGKGIFTRFVGWLNGLLNPDHAWFDYGKMDNSISSVQNQLTHEDLTGEQQAMNRFSASEAQKQRDFEQQMSDTAFQRQVADMRAAGVNPAMAMNGSGGSSTPSGAAAAPGSGSGASLSFSDLMSLIMMPLQKKLLAAQARQASDQGQAALITANANARNAGTNARNAGTNETNAATQRMNAETERMRVEIERARARSQIQVNDADVQRIAAQTAFITLQREQLPKQLDIAQQHADADTRRAIAGLRQAEAAVQNAATNDRLADYETSLKYTQELLTWYQAEGQKVVTQYLPERARVELDNLRKEGVKLDAQGRLINNQGHLVTAQTVKTYVNVGTDISGAVNQWLNPFSRGAGSSATPGFDLTGAYQGVAYGYD